MESPLQVLIIIEETSVNSAPLEAALSISCAVSFAQPDRAEEVLGTAIPHAVLLAGVAPERAREICLGVRAKQDPLIALLVYTPVSGKASRLSLLGAGADDVIESATDGEEIRARLVARVERLREVARHRGTDHSIRAGRLCLDLDRMEARVGSDRISLGPVEFKILCVLARGIDKLRSRDEIETFVWGENKPASRALDPHINAIRKKIAGSNLELRTIYGAGYSLRLAGGPDDGRES